MHIYRQIYEFAASAGAFEGYVYQKSLNAIDMEALSNWIDNLLDAYEYLPSDVREEFQSACDQTLGRALRSLVSALGEENKIVGKLKSMVKGILPESPDAFNKDKWFEENL